ncbi:c0e399e1-ae17-4358-9707-7aec48750082 [Thermothielavioides terrestris]|uniref:C0e399e1-ae17-4358-9707-7aec48750082 n=1 Tax=Thermothielavioides terrestris TaxID=2587410 RepID=A0A446BNW8_9PEZI|nr:c0e399e1-ae17-4358-9707-7aec48750082 [Thermothielavioides terrestris]
MSRMGGLVVKRACILGSRELEFKPVVDRVCSIFFLATPHQGAAIAQTISRLAAIVGFRPFVEDLSPQSALIQSITEDFPRVCGNLQLFSFYETRPMSVGVSRMLIVDKSSAVMNLANERRTFLDADHRNVAMYSTPEDPSYVSVRNALATVISFQRDSSRHPVQVSSQEGQAALDRFLGVVDGPEDDIMTQESIKLPGSCEWLINKSYYQSWKGSMDSSFLWLRGRPGVGKSVLAGHVVGDLHSQAIHDRLRALISDWKDNPIDKIDLNSLWRKIFLSGILKVKLNRPQFWVIDAMDECKDAADMLTFLARIQEHWPFISSLCLNLGFVEEDAILRVATRENRLVEWDVEERGFIDQDGLTWTTDLPDRMQMRVPMLVELSLSTHLVAVLYRGEDIVFWDCVNNRIYDMYEKNTGSIQMYGRQKLADGSTTVRAAAFGHTLSTCLFAATYADGDLVVYDVERGEAIALVESANTLALAASPDGRTLAGADSIGNFTLFDFETLRPLYRVRFDTLILPSALCFTSDSLRFIEIREDQCRVWEPAVLLRPDAMQDDENSGTVSESTGLQEVDHRIILRTVPEICAITCSQELSLVFCGFEDGSVVAYDVSGLEPEKQLLFHLATIWRKVGLSAPGVFIYVLT